MMEVGTTTRNASRLFAGLVILTLGLLALLDNFGIVHIDSIWRFWPLVLVAVGLAKLIGPRGFQTHFGGFILLIVGVWLLLENIGVWHHSLIEIWPVFVVLIGVRLIWGGMGRIPQSSSQDATSRVTPFAMLGGNEQQSSSQDFRGGAANAILGGCKVDLRQASIKEGPAILDAFALWGGVEIFVPRSWNIVVRGTPILGGFEDKTAAPTEGGGPTLIVTGAAIMGGVEIKN
jgi:predicted membrane protein